MTRARAPQLPGTLDVLELTPTDRSEVAAVVDGVRREYSSVEDPSFLREAVTTAHGLPLRVRRFLDRFRLEPSSGLCLIRTGAMDDAVGPTPKHWRDAKGDPLTLATEIELVLYASLLGDVFGWATQQDGSLVHDVVPIPGHEHEQLGSSSCEPLMWHTEDAFHHLRANHVAFVCLRNPDYVATTAACIDAIELSPASKELLFEPLYRVLPDNSHLRANNAASADFSVIERMLEAPDEVPILFGDRSEPFICVDPSFTDVVDDRAEARAAFDELQAAVDRALIEIPLQSGDFLFIDNFKVVHGRRSFTARYDADDRWLKRVNITADLGKSRAERGSHESRCVGTGSG